MKKNFVTLLATLCLCLTLINCVRSDAKGGDNGGADVVNNGGGASEQAVIYTFLNYEFLLSPCWKLDSCNLAVDEKAALVQIIADLPYENINKLEFLSSKEMGSAQISTANSVGSPIRINKDLLWKKNSKGEIESYTIADAVQLLTSALGLHQQKIPRELGITLSSKLRTYTSDKRVSFLPYLTNSNFRLLTIKDPIFSRMILEDGYDAFFDISALINQKIECPISQFSVYSFQWGDLILPDTEPIRSTISGRISWLCENSDIRHRASVTIISLGMPVTGTVDEYWRNRGGTLKMLKTPPQVVLSDIE